MLETLHILIFTYISYVRAYTTNSSSYTTTTSSSSSNDSDGNYHTNNSNKINIFFLPVTQKYSAALSFIHEHNLSTKSVSKK